MKIKLIQDSIVFISSLTQKELDEANRFCPGATTLIHKDEDTKKAEPVCMIAYAGEGSVSDNGIVFDSTTEEGYMCKTLIAARGFDEPLSVEEKIKALSEEFASLILNMNELENQIKESLEANAEKINAALNSVEAVKL